MQGPQGVDARRRSSSGDSSASAASAATVLSAAAASVLGEAGAADGSSIFVDLTLYHACIHCRASKTACTDCRPCVRCTRLGLDCSAYMDKPRKRACVSCHTNKVACDLHLSGDDACTRCKRLNNTCVPREQVRQRGVRKRRRKGEEGEEAPLGADVLLLAAGTELSRRGDANVAASPEAAGAGFDTAAELLLGLATGSFSRTPTPPPSSASHLDLVALSLKEEEEEAARNSVSHNAPSVAPLHVVPLKEEVLPLEGHASAA